MKKTVILFDIDHTLFNSTEYLKKMLKGMAKIAKAEDEEAFIDLAEEAYSEMRKVGPFFPEAFAKIIVEKLTLPVQPKDLEKAIYDEEILRGVLFKETIEVLKTLSKKMSVTLGIFSAGPLVLQEAKIKTIAEYFPKRHTHIFLKKDEEVLAIVKKYREDRLFLVDDILKILATAKKVDSNVYTIWVKRGWSASRQKEIVGFIPDKTITNLKEMLPIFNK